MNLICSSFLSKAYSKVIGKDLKHFEFLGSEHLLLLRSSLQNNQGPKKDRGTGGLLWLYL